MILYKLGQIIINNNNNLFHKKAYYNIKYVQLHYKGDFLFFKSPKMKKKKIIYINAGCCLKTTARTSQ